MPIKKSVFPDYIVCLEDGKKLQTLKRHLNASHGMTPEEYRARWSLPRDYPMVAPKYAARRSALAKEIGLGRKPGSLGGTRCTARPASSGGCPGQARCTNGDGHVARHLAGAPFKVEPPDGSSRQRSTAWRSRKRRSFQSVQRR